MNFVIKSFATESLKTIVEAYNETFVISNVRNVSLGKSINVYSFYESKLKCGITT